MSPAGQFWLFTQGSFRKGMRAEAVILPESWAKQITRPVYIQEGNNILYFFKGKPVKYYPHFFSHYHSFIIFHLPTIIYFPLTCKIRSHPSQKPHMSHPFMVSCSKSKISSSVAGPNEALWVPVLRCSSSQSGHLHNKKASFPPLTHPKYTSKAG